MINFLLQIDIFVSKKINNYINNYNLCVIINK